MFQSTSATFSAYASTSVWGFFKLSPARALLRAPEAQRWHRASAVQRCKRKDDAKRLHLLVRIYPWINHMKLDKHTHTKLVARGTYRALLFLFISQLAVQT
jgi:hypothetical protein